MQNISATEQTVTLPQQSRSHEAVSGKDQHLMALHITMVRVNGGHLARKSTDQSTATEEQQVIPPVSRGTPVSLGTQNEQGPRSTV